MTPISDLQSVRGIINGLQDEIDTAQAWVTGTQSVAPANVAAPSAATNTLATRDDAARDFIETRKGLQRAQADLLASEAEERLVHSLRKIEWSLFAIWVVALAVVLNIAISTWTPAKDTDPPKGEGAPGWLAAFEGRNPLVLAVIAAAIVLGVIIIIGLLRLAQGGAIRVLIKPDLRFSTSYFQAWMWTVILVWAFVFFIVQQIVAQADVLSSTPFDLNPDYLLLLGGPFAAVAVALQVDQARVASGELQTTLSNKTTLTELFTDDDGRVDLVDTQYLLFNLVAVAVFASMLWLATTELPDLPDGIIMLTSTAALGYITRKAIVKNAPAILSVVALDNGGQFTKGTLVRISGVNFIPAGSSEDEYKQAIKVKFNTTAGIPVKATRDSVDVRIPTDAGPTQVVVVSAAEVETAPYTLTVV